MSIALLEDSWICCREPYQEVLSGRNKKLSPGRAWSPASVGHGDESDLVFTCVFFISTSKTWSFEPGQSSMAMPVNIYSGFGVLE